VWGAALSVPVGVHQARLSSVLEIDVTGEALPAGGFVRTRGWPGRSPGRGVVHWVAPELVGEIVYQAFTRDAGFRHPSWRGLRPDRDPDEVHLPTSEP
jgi:hypothetical protein